tara:strand:+ start:224 stop:1474 length:1251 start_codon:yes stop_codon:yes gene_type:complete
MTVVVGRSHSFTLSLRAYTITLILSSALYFLRAPGVSIYIFDLIWFFGLALFPRYFLRMPRANYLSLIALSAATFLSVCYAGIDNRPIDPIQAVIILMRFIQMSICANFFYNCVRAGKLLPRNFLFPALFALAIPLLGGLALYLFFPGMAVVFNRYSGYLGNPNFLALYVVVSAPVFYVLMRFELMPRWSTLPITSIFFSTASYSLMLTGSNSGMLLFVFVTMIALLTTFLGRVLLILLVVVFLMFVLSLQNAILPWALDMMNSDFAGWRRTGNLMVVILEGFDLDQLGSSTYRDEVQVYLFEQQFSDFRRILVGLGPGQSKHLTYFVDGLTVTIHNFYLLIFLEFGVLGTACFTAVSYFSFNRYQWGTTTLLIFSGFLVASFGTPALYLPFFWVPLFAALAGLTQTNVMNRMLSS